MMKVTKLGTKPSEAVWAGRCNSCTSEAEATTDELKNITTDFREGGQFSWEKCPVCGAGANDTGYGGMIFYPKTSDA